MATLKERLPRWAQDPVAICSIGVMIVGMTIGYIVTLYGISVYLGLVLPESLTTVDAAAITAVGIATIAVGWLGWRGFMYFSY